MPQRRSSTESRVARSVRKPASGTNLVVREYERSLRLHVLPTLGGAKLAKIQRRDVQRLTDELLASAADPSTIRNALKPLQVIYRRAIEDGDPP